MNRSKAQPWAAQTRRLFMRVALPATLLALGACGDGDNSEPDPTGQFGDSSVSGLNYSTATGSGVTDASGRFSYKAGQSVAFSIGNLPLGSANAAAVLTPLSITAGAATAADQAVNNKLILLQTLDVDGNLNNGIQLTDAIRSAVSARAAAINFNQTTAAFRTSLADLMTALNAGAVFTDTDPRDRTVRTAVAALEHFNRATAERNTVTTDTGPLRGYSPTAGTWQYLGIPYAAPPLANLRWRPPQTPAPWVGTRDAVAWGDQAPQNPAYQAFGEGGMSEDCLYLNVTAPKNANNLPVMVWFHGGGFVILTGNTKAFNNAASLPTRDVVLVSVNHRLGPFGYLAHPALTTESGYGGSGNYGQMDQIAALNWVKNNIARFGGNPGNVTIFGESGGGGKVISLMNSPLATGLFHKAIVQSGMADSAMTILNVPPLAQAEAVGTDLLTRLATPTLAQARAKTWVEIINAELAHYPRGDYKDAYGPNIDSHYATKSMRQNIEDGLPSDVPLLAGNNSGDM
ncbi:MAG: carboxylesterase family protein, partial [Cytophagales bacterium]|nr:carboxylesterase family protein [Rhizobacter sp.]